MYKGTEMIKIFLFGTLLLLANISPTLAQSTALNAGGAGGGSIIPGADSRSCAPALAGALRYDSATNCVQYCDGINAWICPNSAGGCATPEFAWGMKYTNLGGTYGWKSIEFSNDGNVLIAASHSENSGSGIVVISTNGGQTFTQVLSPGNWWDVAISANGAVMAAVNRGGQIHVSTNTGASWTAYAGSLNWRSIDMSASGAIMLAAVDGGRLWVSTNTGSSWGQRDTVNRNWRGVGVSADGTRMVAAANNNRILASTNSGTGFSVVTTSNAGWDDIDISGDGTRIYAVNGGDVSISTNMGTSWTTTAASGNGAGNFVVTTHDGATVLTGNWQRTINMSRNSGASFQIAPFSPYWSDGAGISPDGTRAGQVDHWAGDHLAIGRRVCVQ